MKSGSVDACTGVIFENPILETASRTHGDNGGPVRDSHDCFPPFSVAGTSETGAGEAEAAPESALDFEAFGFDFEIDFVGAILQNSGKEKSRESCKTQHSTG